MRTKIGMIRVGVFCNVGMRWDAYHILLKVQSAASSLSLFRNRSIPLEHNISFHPANQNKDSGRAGVRFVVILNCMCNVRRDRSVYIMIKWKLCE